jgi:hypothetical protein
METTMGLDMYLYGESYFSRYSDVEEHGTLNRSRLARRFTKLGGFATGINFQLAYWRKANHIHQWFVTNTQDGVDECQRSKPVRVEQLIELRDLCRKLLTAMDTDLAMEALPPQSGFFFGSTEVGEWYWEDLQLTVKMFKKFKLEDPKSPIHKLDIYYQSSW